MSILNTVSAAAGIANFGGSALSLLGMGKALFKDKSLAKGLDGFIFDIALTETITQSAQITEHYAEDNSAIQDHIAINPLSITLTGKIGENVFRKNKYLEFIKAMNDRLTPLGVLKPSQSLLASQAISAAYLAVSAFDSVEKNFNNLKDTITGSVSLNKQQTAYGKLEEKFLLRKIITVETPWRTFENMVIESLEANQDETTTMETTFTLTMKQMRFVGVQSKQGFLVSSRYGSQKGAVENKGNQTGIPQTAEKSASIMQKTAGP